MRQGLPSFLGVCWLLGGAAVEATDLAPGGEIVLSEICYNVPSTLGPDLLYEFVEIHNRAAEARDVSGWRLKDRDDLHDFSIPPGTSIAPGGYLVVAGNADALRHAYAEVLAGRQVVGDMGFPLGNDGDTVRLLDPQGRPVDQVTYAAEFPWPLAADGFGSTLERIALESDITDFSNFAASASSRLPGTPGAANSRAGRIARRHDVVLSEIMYNPVMEPGARPLRHCPGEEFLELFNRGTEPADLSGWYFVRGIEFTFPEGTTLAPRGHLVLYKDRAAFDEKYGSLGNAIGPYLQKLDDGGEELLLVDSQGHPVDHVDYDDAPPWPVNPDGLKGSLELVDPFADNDRGRAWEESADPQGSPGAANSAMERFEAAGGNQGPQITKVRALPAKLGAEAEEGERIEIRSTDAVRIEARILDRQGVSGARLEYQVCVAGDYIPLDDPRFQTDWQTAEMAYDSARTVYHATLPPLPHRTLLRYRVVATDAAAVPLESRSLRRDDPEPNHAYFVYDGAPDYVASQRSAFGDPGYVHTNLDRVPLYLIIGRERDIEELLYTRFPDGDKTYRWQVTFVHEGRVYDHCGVRLRGGHRYSWPKRPLKVRFNKGNLFRGRFLDGSRYPRGRRRINLNTAQHDPGKPRGEAGVFESLAWRLFREAGVMGSTTNLVHLRIIRSAEEHDQFLGDFFGIYVEIQPIDATALQDRGRPADELSSLYKMDGLPLKEHPDCDPSTADVDAFMSGYRRTPTREWFEEHLDIPRYLSFRSVVELTDDHDMDSLKNFYYYFNSDNQRWEVIPWDLDNTFGAQASGDEPLRGPVLAHYRLEYGNRFRFLWQVHYDERRLFDIIDAWSERIGPLADADQDRWDTEPRAACPSWPDTEGGNCLAYRQFAFRMRNLKLWIRTHTQRVRLLFHDPAIPETPSNLKPSDGSPVMAPVSLQASPFLDPDEGDSHARSRWLLIERGGDWAFPLWESTTADNLEETTLPPGLTRVGGQYLFRVSYEDSSGRWSFLSEPTSFAVGPVDSTPPAAPDGLELEHAGARAVVLRWQATVDGESGVFGYHVLRDGERLTAAAVPDARYADFAPRAGGTHSYQVLAVNSAGLESPRSPSLDVRVPLLEGLGGWQLPEGGLDYLYDALPGEDAYSGRGGAETSGNLDGSWARSSTDGWDGSRPGEAGGAPGGIGIESIEAAGDNGGPATVLSFEDPGDPSLTVPPPNNQRLFLLRPAGESSPLDDGVTLMARLRVNPEPVDLAEAIGQSPETALPRGQIGIAHRGGDGRVNFYLWLDGNRLSIAGGHTTPVEMTVFQSLWITLERESEAHRARVFLNGSSRPAIDARVDLPSRGTESGYTGDYLQMGLGNRAASGAIQVDYFGYRRGVSEPVPLDTPAGRFVRGDANADGSVDVSDALWILDYLFHRGAAPACFDAADSDDSGSLNITDAVYLLFFRFRGANPPASPFPGCGEDSTADSLGPCKPGICP